MGFCSSKLFFLHFSKKRNIWVGYNALLEKKEIRLNDSFIYKSGITNKLVMNGKIFFWKLYLLENTLTMVYLSVQMNVNFIYTLFTTCFQLHSLSRVVVCLHIPHLQTHKGTVERLKEATLSHKCPDLTPSSMDHVLGCRRTSACIHIWISLWCDD